MNILADKKYDGTLERTIALYLDQGIIGGTLVLDKDWDKFVIRMAKAIRTLHETT